MAKALSPYTFKIWTNGVVVDPAHPRFQQNGIISGFERDEHRNITSVEIHFHPYGSEGPRVWFTPDQVDEVKS